MRWVLQHKTPIVISLGIVISIVVGFWFWGVLVGYVNPGTKGATDRKDVVQAFALIAAGIVGLIGGVVGIANLSVSRRNLEQQIVVEEQRRESALHLENQRIQEAALQAYFEQIGGLLTDQDLVNTDREDIRQLAKAQTFTILARLDGPRKGALVSFLHGARLIKRDEETDESIVTLAGANLIGADLSDAYLPGADLAGAYLHRANLSDANLRDAKLHSAYLNDASLRDAYLSDADVFNAHLDGADLVDADLVDADLSGSGLRGADLSDAILFGANLFDTDLSDANLSGAGVAAERLAACRSLKGATVPNGQKYEDWLKDRENGKNE
jgi:uncharacterized protein YjbI with pentapeptide repeats